MTTLTLLHGVGSIGAFANRAFLPALLTALFLRFGPELPWLSWIPLLQQVKDTPIWFTHDITLLVLGVLTLAETFLHKSATWREWTQNGQEWLQTGVAVLTTLGVISAGDARLALEAAPMSAGFGAPALALAAVVGIGTLAAAGMLARVERSLVATDPDDSFGLGKLFSWSRDLSALGLFLAAILLPWLAVVLVLLLLGILALVSAQLERAERRTRVDCGSCQRPIPRCAPHCGHCHASQAGFTGISWLGYASRRPAGAHPGVALLAVGRCPHCAEFLPGGQLPAHCRSCGRTSLDSAGAVDEYLARVGRRVPATLAFAVACSFLPALGFALSYLANRLALVRPLRAHTPAGRRLLARLGQKILTALALLLHWVPGLGQVLLPLLSWVTWAAHRRAFPRREPGPGRALPQATS